MDGTGSDDAALMAFVRSIAAGDDVEIARVLRDRPELATARLAVQGASRHDAQDYFLDEIAHHVYRGDTALHYAVDGGPGAPHWDPDAQADTVRALLDLGADPDAIDKNGTPPLLRAVRNRCASAVEALLDLGADPSATNANGSTAMDLASWTTGRGGSGGPEARAQQERIVALLTARGVAPSG